MHRSDIDGLRAVAVLSVVFFHLGFLPERIGGGFVGVDVFFVISGYLITGILQKELDTGRFSLLEFYHRRARRIFPALFVMYAFCLIVAACLLFPTQARDVARDVLWSLGFASNVAFSHAEGYFDQTSKTAPLLHTWSLSVEEQFYLGLPLLLLALRRLTPALRSAVVAVLIISSFALCQRLVAVDSRQAFYLVHCRAWELLIGALLALGALPQLRNRIALEVLGVFGLSAIAFAVCAIRGTTPFPGVWALPACLGAAAILYSGQEGRTWTSRLLGTLPLRWVGLISYSLYLWHWPLIAFYQTRNAQLTSLARWEILVATVLVSALSYRFVERPFRTKPYRRNARSTLTIAAVAMAGVALLAVALPVSAARLRPTSARAEDALQYLGYGIDIRTGTCFLSAGFDDAALFRKDLCLQIDPKKKNFLVMGDSHAAHFSAALATTHPEINWLQASASGCQPAQHDPGAKRCTQLFSYIFDEFLPSHHLDAVLLIGRWPMGSLKALKKTIPYLKPLADRVIVFGPIVDYDQPLPQLLARSITENDPTLPARHLLPLPRAADTRYAEQLRSSGAEYYSIYEATCPKGECTLWAAPGVPMQFDQHHLTLPGSELVLHRLGLFR